MRRRSGGLVLRMLGVNRLLVMVALALTILSLLKIPIGGIPEIEVAVLLLCIAWLMG